MNDTAEEVQTEEEIDVNAAVREAFDAGITEEAEEDGIKMSMIGAGATFKNVTRLYNEYMIDAGLAISKADRNQIVEDTLEGLDFETEEDFDSASSKLEEALTGSTERSAAALVRAYAKKTEQQCYAKPKGDGSARNPFVTLFHKSLVENPKMTEKDLKDLIASLDEKDQVNPTRWFNQHNNIRKTANSIAARYEG